MKWRNVLITFTIALPFPANGKSLGLRGKSSRAPQEDVDSVDQLKAENEALMKRNRHLEGMMQVARAEVQRLDKTSRKHGQDVPMQSISNADVLNQEISDLKSKLQGVQADKKALVQTLRKMLSKNATLAFQKQAEKAQQMKFALELKCGQEREALQKQLQDIQQATQKKLNEANGKCDDTKELAQTLQEQNMDLQRNMRDLQTQLAKSAQKEKELASDKASLVATMHSLMSETATYKDALEKEKAARAKGEKDLAADEAKIAKLAPKPKSKPKTRQLRRVANATFSHNHEESEASQMAHMKAINHYIIRSQEDSVEDEDLSFDSASETPEETPQETPQDVSPPPPTDDKGWRSVGKQMDAVQRQEDKMKAQRSSPPVEDAVQRPEDKMKIQPSSPPVEEHANVVANVAPTVTLAPSKAAEGLKEWLGIKTTAAGNIKKDANGLSPIDALNPEWVKQQEKKIQDKKVQMQQKTDGASKKQDDDGGDGIDELLAQAKAQLKAMDDVMVISA